MNEVQEALFDSAFKRSLQGLDELWDLAVITGGGFSEREKSVRAARVELLNARPGFKTETKARVLETEPRRGHAPGFQKDSKFFEGESPLPVLPNGQRVPVEKWGIPFGEFVANYDKAIAELEAGPVETGPPIWLDDDAALATPEPDAADEPIHVSAEGAPLDFEGDWITVDGRQVAIVGPLNGGWIGMEEGTVNSRHWDSNGKNATNPGLSLGERIRSGKFYK